MRAFVGGVEGGGGGRVHSLQIRSATFEIGVTWKVDGITRERERVRKN